MSTGKKRSRQQQIDDKALAILRYKIPQGFVFRELEKDFGIDCELEQFQEIDSEGGSLQASTGVIFKAQVKGVEDGTELELKTKPMLSKGFEIGDVEYWYEQVKIPVILFLVDVGAEMVYWTDFYSNKKLREDYLAVRRSSQQQVSIHFDKGQIIPDTAGELLEAVNDAQQRIALALFPRLDVVEEHLSESLDIEREIAAIEEKRELAYYERFARHLDANQIDQASAGVLEILEKPDFSPNIKFLTIISAGKAVILSSGSQVREDEKFLFVLDWQVKALQKYACVTDATPPLVGQTTDLMQCILNIGLLSRAVFDQRLAIEMFASKTNNPIAQLSLPHVHVREVLAFRLIAQAFEEYNKIAASQDDASLQIRVAALTVPMLAQALVPLRQAYLLAQETEKARELRSYALGLLRGHAIVCAWLSDESLLNQCLTSAISISAQPSDGEHGLDAARQIVDSIDDPDFREKAELILEDLVAHFNRVFEPAQATNEMRMLRETALRLAAMQGYDLTIDSQDAGYEDELDRGIHDVLRHGIEELDLTEYLKDCQYRHIFKPEFSGISPVADAIGLGFAASRKSVVCLRKQVFAGMVAYHLKDTFDRFYDKYCANCSQAMPHAEGWQYSYDWQRGQDIRFQEKRERRQQGIS